VFDFKLFNIPVRVEPWFWVTGFLLGGGLHLDLGRQALLSVLLWMIVVFVSIMVHEFGHALTSRKLTRVNPSVKLWAMGGLAYPNTNLSRKESFWVTWAGPLAGLAFFVLILLGCCLTYGFGPGSRVIAFMAFPPGGFLDLEAVKVLREMNWAVFEILYALVFVNFWWSIVNLLPVFPLDGGQIYASVETSERKVFQVGLVTGVLAAAAFLFFGRWFAAALFGYLAYQNYQRLQQINGGSGFR
jgi:Zn-dependent protease